MEIAVKYEVSLFFHALDQLLCMINSWMKFLIRVDPLTIEVHQTQVASIIANDDTIRVEHGHYFEDEIFSEDLGNIGVAEQVLDDILYNV